MVEIADEPQTDLHASPPLVSVIIPCFNYGCYLADALQSVRTQSYGKIEIIVVDDGSTDNSSEIAAGFSDVRCLRQANQGLAAARNAGIHASQGTYLVFLDADDRLLPHAIQIGVETLEQHSDTAFVYGHCTLISPAGEPLFTPYQKAISGDHYLHFLQSCFVWTPGTAMFRRSMLDLDGGFDVTVNATADYEMYLRLSKQHPVHCHDQLVLEYRQHASNMSGDPKLMLRSVLPVLYRQSSYVLGRKDLEEAWRSGIESYQLFYGDPLIQEARFRSHEKIQHIAKALAITQEADKRAALILEWRYLYGWTHEVFQMKQDICLRERGKFDLSGGDSSGASQQFGALVKEFALTRETLSHELQDLHQRLTATETERSSAEARLENLCQELTTARSVSDCHSREVQALRKLLRGIATDIGNAPNAESLTHNIHEFLSRWETIQHFRTAVDRLVPPHASLGVVSKGDRELLQLGDRRAVHFPGGTNGDYCGYHPEGSPEAIECLERARADGLEYLAFPRTSVWWLDHYTEFAHHLKTHYRMLENNETPIFVLNNS